VHSSCISEWILCLLKKKPLAVPCCELCGGSFQADITPLAAQVCYWTLLRKFCQLGCKEMLLTIAYLFCFILAILLGW
jgi:transcription elongation factor Elf1